MNWSRLFDEPLDHRHPARHAIWSPILGVVQEQLNLHLTPTGYLFGPDTSTSNRATLGGMIGNNSAGSHSILYGKTIDHVLEMHVTLADGELPMSFDPFAQEPGAPQVCQSGTPLTYQNIAVQRINSTGTFNLSKWTGTNVTSYTVSANAGVLSSTQSGGGIY